MRLSSNKLTVRLRRHLFDERTLTAGWLALTICLVIAAPGALAQGPNPSPTGTATGTMPTEAPGNFKRKTRLMQDDTQAADSGDGSPDMMRRKRMRQAIMRARQMDAGSDGQPAETLNRGPNGDEAFTGTMGRKGRGAFMPDGPGQGAGQGRRGFGGRGAFAGRKRALDLAPLNLTEEQKGKIQQLRIRTATRSRELRRKLMSGGQELRDLMFDPSASDDTIRAKGRELRKLHEQVEDIKIDDFLSIRSVLTAEQRKRLPEVKPSGSRAAMGGGGRRNMGDPPPPPPGGELGSVND